MSTERNYIEDNERITRIDTEGLRDSEPELHTDAPAPASARRNDEDRRELRTTDITSKTGAYSLEDSSYLPEQTQEQAGARWQHIQADFVDDPRKAVNEAHELVSEIMQRVVDTFTQERSDLERQWSGGDDVSTENLRVCMQRYRSFFSRLLPLEEQSKNANSH